MNDFYVYAYYSDEIPFYVGKGRNRRAYEHWNSARKGSFSKVNKLLAAKFKLLISEQKEPTIKLIFTGLTSEEAIIKEEDLIKKLGQKIHGTGPLLNILSTGCRPASSNGKKKEISDETKKLISEGLKRAYKLGYRERKMPVTSTSSEMKRRDSISKSLKGRKTGPISADRASKISQSLRDRAKSDSHKLSLSESMLGKSPSKTRKVLYTITAKNGDLEIIENNTSVKQFSEKYGLNASSLYKTLTRKSPVKFGKTKGWQIISLLNKCIVIS